MIDARYASLLAFAQSRGFCATGIGNGIDNSCGSKTMSAPDGVGGGSGTYDPGHFDVGPDPNGLTEKDLMYSPTVKWTQNHESLVRDAVKSWKGSPTDMTLHVMSELNGDGVPGSGSGKIMRAQATALLNEVLDNGEPAPTLYRGASIPPEQDPSPLLGWTSKKSVAVAFAKKNNGEVYTLKGASGLDTSKIKAHGMGEAEWIVAHNIPDGYSKPIEKPSWMGAVDASGSTKHGGWFLEQNTSKSKSAGHDDITSHVVRLVGSDGAVKAFAQSRGFCATGTGGGIDNSCGAKTMSAPDKDGGGSSSSAPAATDTWDESTWSDNTTGGGTFDELPDGLSSLGSLSFHPSTTTADVMGIAKQTGIKGPAQLLTIGACNVPKADVRLSLHRSDLLTLRADIPAGSKKSDGSIEVDTSIMSGEDGPQIDYGLLSLDETAQAKAANDESFQRRVAGKVMDVMLSSMEAAEKAGFVSAETLADGYGPGNTNGKKTELQGYRLWGKFGFDGEVPRGWFMNLKNNGIDVSEALTPLDSIRLREDGVVRLQQILATKKGEAIWKQWGIPLPLTFEFTNKKSDGYLRYQRMLSLSKKAKSYRSQFFEYVAGLELREDPSLWSGFVEQRVFCPNGEGNGITNDCGPGQTAKSFPEGSQNLRDAVDSVAPAPEQVWDRSKGLAETPPAKQMDDIANEQTSNTGVALTPEAEASYGSLVDEIGRQYEALTAAGLKARAWRGDGEPYGDPPGSTKPNSNKMREEVAKTGEFSFYMTDKGFGTGDATPDHPMLRETKYKTADGEPMIANDLFRVVHDMVAHVRGGYSFSTNGEYNGMLTHASTLPEAAWPALFAETFGQNAVYEKTKNYAPQNAYASKVGPEIIRSELKKRNKSSRSKKDDGDEPLGYQHLKSRPALLKSLVEARAFCATGEGNGIDNSCGAKTMSAPDKDSGGGGSTARPSRNPDTFPDTWNTDSSKVIRDGLLPAGLEKLGSFRLGPNATPREVMKLSQDMGIKSPQNLVTIGACNVTDADVTINQLSSNALTARADIPAGEGTIFVDTTIRNGEDGPTIDYKLLDLDDAAREQAANDEGFKRRVAGQMYDVMLSSMEAAEKAGFIGAETVAEGHGSGNNSDSKTTFQGYRLWGRFGFDAKVPRRWFASVKDKGVDVHSALNPLDRDQLSNEGVIRLQQILATKQGEQIWKKWGIALGLTFDFTNKGGDGYLRYKKMLAASKRATSKRDFFEYVSGLEMREDPSLWSGFAEERGFCPNGTGGGVTNTCGKGIGINDADQDFTGQILSGEKTMETRRPNSLKPYIGKTVGIVRTGKGKATLVGVMKVGEPKFYKTRKEFDADFDKHRVGKDSVHYIGPEGKYGYPLTEVKPVKPRVLKSTGHVARVIAKKVKTRDLLVKFDLDVESPEEPNTESRGDAPAPKKDQVKGSDVNDEGSAKNKSGDISLDEGTISSLKKKVEEHNAAMREAGKPDWTHVRLPSLKAVFRRGAGAFSTSHRPGMTRDQWAMARVNAFLTLARRGRPENSKYTTDNDLLHSSHPKHSKESRYASLLAFAQARGFCPTGEGGGIDNSCGAKVMMAPDKDGGGGSPAPAIAATTMPTIDAIGDGSLIDISGDEDWHRNTESINWQAAADVSRGNEIMEKAILKYTVADKAINAYYRNDNAATRGSEKLRSDILALESAIKDISLAANPNSSEIITFRGLNSKQAGGDQYTDSFKSVSVGDVIKEDGILSTSASLLRTAMVFTQREGGVIFRVKGKSGAPIAYLSRHAGEYEVIYPHRCQFVVTSVARGVTVKLSNKQTPSSRLTNVTFIDIREVD